MVTRYSLGQTVRSMRKLGCIKDHCFPFDQKLIIVERDSLSSEPLRKRFLG